MYYDPPIGPALPAPHADRDEQLLAEVADDLVHATVAGGGAVFSEWREVEVEFGECGKPSRAADVPAALIIRSRNRATCGWS